MVPAILVLEDGSSFKGRSIGVQGECVGEVVFNTAMTGYQEIISDPSYAEQIVALTSPHIGNVGTNSFDNEASNPFLSALIVRDVPHQVSNFRSEESLSSYLTARNILGISDIDTRRLTRLLREKGALNGCIITGRIDEAAALKRAKSFRGLKGQDLAKIVSTKEPYKWIEGTWNLNGTLNRPSSHIKIVAYDFGIKQNILRILIDFGCSVEVVPAETSAQEVFQREPDGVFLSNGPGDPEPCSYAIEAIKEFIKHGTPLFGICLGHQLLALAAGGKTIKMKFGHHGANHPVLDLTTNRVSITSQNHGFAVDEESLPVNVEITHRSLFDNSIQGISLTNAPAFSFQGHPEASPGPHDINEIFGRFISLIKTNKGLDNA